MMHSSGVWEMDFQPEKKMLFDYVRCSMDIGCLTDVTCETLSLGGNMMRYWISPAGQLFIIDYEGTHDFVAVDDLAGLSRGDRCGHRGQCCEGDLLEVFHSWLFWFVVWLRSLSSMLLI